MKDLHISNSCTCISPIHTTTVQLQYILCHDLVKSRQTFFYCIMFPSRLQR